MYPEKLSRDEIAQSDVEFKKFLMEKLDEICQRVSELEQGKTEQTKKWFSTNEVAEIVGKKPYTVREWCRQRRIDAQKRETGFGKTCEWEVSAEELDRYNNHGLLPVPPKY